MVAVFYKTVKPLDLWLYGRIFFSNQNGIFLNAGSKTSFALRTIHATSHCSYECCATRISTGLMRISRGKSHLKSVAVVLEAPYACGRFPKNGMLAACLISSRYYRKDSAGNENQFHELSIGTVEGSFDYFSPLENSRDPPHSIVPPSETSPAAAMRCSSQKYNSDNSHWFQYDAAAEYDVAIGTNSTYDTPKWITKDKRRELYKSMAKREEQIDSASIIASPLIFNSHSIVTRKKGNSRSKLLPNGEQSIKYLEILPFISFSDAAEVQKGIPLSLNTKYLSEQNHLVEPVDKAENRKAPLKNAMNNPEIKVSFVLKEYTKTFGVDGPSTKDVSISDDFDMQQEKFEFNRATLPMLLSLKESKRLHRFTNPKGDMVMKVKFAMDKSLLSLQIGPNKSTKLLNFELTAPQTHLVMRLLTFVFKQIWKYSFSKNLLITSHASTASTSSKEFKE